MRRLLALALILAYGCAPKPEPSRTAGMTAGRSIPPPVDDTLPGEETDTLDQNAASLADPGDSEEVRYFLQHKERWAVKTGADRGSGRFNLNAPRPATVAELTSLPRPENLPRRSGQADTRFRPVETTLYTLDVDIVRYKLEKDDQDYHVVVKDHNGGSQTMIVEFPDPTFISRRSPFRQLAGEARDAFFERFRPTSAFKRKTAHARITGVGFFDFIHGQSGVAPNGIEIHPVIGVKFLN